MVSSAYAQDRPSQIESVGSGKAVAVPDLAFVAIGISAKAPSPALALDKGAGIVGTITSGLTALEVQERDVQTDGLNLQPNYSPENCNRGYNNNDDAPCKLDGYAVDTNLTIRVRDLKKLAPVLDMLGKSEVERIRSISLAVSDPQKFQDAAYADALRDAKRIADLTASTLGVTLLNISDVRKTGSSSYDSEPATLSDGIVFYYNDGGSADLGVLVARGELTFASYVQITWNISTPK
jgi:uncharacterized protein YggE